jgi:hypothetical protein
MTDLALPNIEIVALSPGEMGQAQASLIDWCHAKIAEVGGEIADAKERVRVTTGSALESDTFTRQVTKLSKTLTFYTKILSALKAGYLIVPNFPINAFAIRTSRINPSEHANRYRFSVADQTPMMLPEGEGRYVAPQTRVAGRSTTALDPKTKEEIEVPEYYASGFLEIGFPAVLAHPKVLDATKHALARKLFDEIGLVGTPAPKADPIVAGRIYLRRTPASSQHVVTFFIAWWLNTRAL